MINLLSSNLSLIINFPTRFLTVAFFYRLISSFRPWHLFYSGFPSLGNSDHVTVSFPIDFPSHSKGNAPFYSAVLDYSCIDWSSFHDQ